MNAPTVVFHHLVVPHARHTKKSCNARAHYNFFSSRQLTRRAASQRNLFIHRFCRLTQDIFHLPLCRSIRCRTRLPRLSARNRPIRHIRLYGNRAYTIPFLAFINFMSTMLLSDYSSSMIVTSSVMISCSSANRLYSISI